MAEGASLSLVNHREESFAIYVPVILVRFNSLGSVITTQEPLSNSAAANSSRFQTKEETYGLSNRREGFRVAEEHFQLSKELEDLTNKAYT